MNRVLIAGMILACTAGSGARTVEEVESIVQAKPNFADTLWGHLLKFFPDSVEQARIVAFPFLDESAERISTGGTWISEYFVYLMRGTERFEVVNRKDFRKALRRIDLSPKDAVDDSTAGYVARQLGAGYMLTGRVAPASGHYEVAARIMDAGTGIIVTGASVPATSRAMEELETLLLKRKQLGTIRPALLRSMVIPGWGQFYRDRNAMGWVSLGLCTSLLGYTTYYCFGPFREAVVEWNNFQQYIDQSDELMDTIDILKENPEEGRSRTEILKDIDRVKGGPIDEQLTERGVTLGLLTGATAIAWTANILDVIIAGRNLDRKYRLFFTGDFVNEAGVMVCLHL